MQWLCLELSAWMNGWMDGRTKPYRSRQKGLGAVKIQSAR